MKAVAPLGDCPLPLEWSTIEPPRDSLPWYLRYRSGPSRDLRLPGVGRWAESLDSMKVDGNPGSGGGGKSASGVAIDRANAVTDDGCASYSVTRLWSHGVFRNVLNGNAHNTEPTAYPPSSWHPQSEISSLRPHPQPQLQGGVSSLPPRPVFTDSLVSLTAAAKAGRVDLVRSLLLSGAVPSGSALAEAARRYITLQRCFVF